MQQRQGTGKSREEYSRNVKKLKVKLAAVQRQIDELQSKVQTMQNVSNDKLMSMKIARFCKERRFTPETLFRFADRKRKGTVSRAEFSRTLSEIGLKLTKDQAMRLEYLLDQDLSGQVSWQQFNGYLNAFGLKKEYDADAESRKKDFENILQGIVEKESLTKEKRQQLLDYEQYLKYCHKHLPGISNKDLAAIFNRLSRNGKISLQDLSDYLQQIHEEKRRLEEKNKKRTVTESTGDIKKQISSLKGIILALLGYRRKQGGLAFHSSQFSRLERVMSCPRGYLLNLFKEIDTKKKGSIDYDQIIRYYLLKETKQQATAFAFELMGKKAAVQGHTPEQVIVQYSDGNDTITDAQLTKWLSSEYGLGQADIKKMIDCLRRQNEPTKVQEVVRLMSGGQFAKRIIYVKPSLVKISSSDYYRKEDVTITYSGEVALRFCIQIAEQLKDVKQAQWYDWEFGPTENDPSGQDTIGLPNQTDSTIWLRTEELGMNEFSNSQCYLQRYSSGILAVHELLPKSLLGLAQRDVNAFNWQSKIDFSVRNIDSSALKPLFAGVYPLVFHSFARYGIYVIKLFALHRWVYVLIDNLIPCGPERTPLFSSAPHYSWISLIEKACAKLLGSYRQLYEFGLSTEYISLLSRSLLVRQQIAPNVGKQPQQLLWNGIKESIAKSIRVYCMRSKEKQGTILYHGINTQIPSSESIPIQHIFEVGESSSASRQRILLVRPLSKVLDESKWNHLRRRDGQDNPYSFEKQLVSKQKVYWDGLIAMDYQQFGEMFDSVLRYYPVDYGRMVMLRKQIEFEQTFKCRYEWKVDDDCRLIATLRRIQSPPQTNLLLELTNPDRKYTYSGKWITEEFLLLKTMPCSLQLSVANWRKDAKHIFELTFYSEHNRFSLQQRDRHLLFNLISEEKEEAEMQFSNFHEKTKDFLVKNYYRAADRRGCCGCL